MPKKKVSNPITSVELYIGNNFYKAVLSVLTEIMYFYSVRPLPAGYTCIQSLLLLV